MHKYLELIDMPNKNSETPIILGCMNGHEDIYYLMKDKANMESKDKYGNTVYHYICKNAICMGIIVDNQENLFGLTPKDYCKISNNYYVFT